MTKFIDFTRKNIGSDDYPIWAYEAEGDFSQDVKKIRIVKDRKSTYPVWDIRVLYNDGVSFIIYTSEATKKYAAYYANKTFNHEYDFMTDMDAACKHYKLS